MCTHNWHPIPNWFARYRCALCNVIGRKRAAVVPLEEMHRFDMRIVAYRCRAKTAGKRCRALAVESKDGRHRCSRHVARHTDGARQVAPRAVEVRSVPLGTHLPGNDVLSRKDAR